MKLVLHARRGLRFAAQLAPIGERCTFASRANSGRNRLFSEGLLEMPRLIKAFFLIITATKPRSYLVA